MPCHYFAVFELVSGVGRREKVKRHRLVRAYLMCGTVATAC